MFKKFSAYISLYAALVSALTPSWGWATLSDYESKILQIKSNKVEDYDALPSLLRQESIPTQYDKIRLVHKLPPIDQKDQYIPIKEVFLSTRALSSHAGYIIEKLILPEGSLKKTIRHIGETWLIIEELIGNADDLELMGHIRIERSQGLFKILNILSYNTIIEFQDSGLQIGLLTLPRDSKVYLPSLHNVQEIQSEGELLSENTLDFSHMSPHQLRHLGTIQSEGNLVFNMGGWNVYEFLNQYKDSFFASSLHITADQFRMLGDLEIRIPLNLILTSFLNEYLLKTGSLYLQTKTFQNGTSNDVMGQMEVYGTLDLISEEKVDNRFGKIKASGRTRIEGKKGVMNGAPIRSRQNFSDKTPWEWFCSSSYYRRVIKESCRGLDIQEINEYSFSIKNFFLAEITNKSLISSLDHLEISSELECIDNSFGVLYGHESLRLKTNNILRNLTGQIVSSSDIYINANRCINECGDVHTFVYDICYELPNGDNSFDRYMHNYIVSTESIIKSLAGNIYFKVSGNLLNRGSQILSSKEIFFNGALLKKKGNGDIIVPLQIDQLGVESYDLKIGYPNKDPHNRRTLPAQILAGESIIMDTDGLTISGTVNAPNVRIKASLMEMYGQYLTVMPSHNAVVVDLGRMALDQAQRGGMLHLSGASLVPPLLQEEQDSVQRQATSMGTSSSSRTIPKVRIVEQHQHPHLKKLTQRSSEEETYAISSSQRLPESSHPSLTFNPRLQFSTNPSVRTNFLSAACLEYTFMDMCAKLLSGLNIDGLSGSSLIENLQSRGKQAERLLSDQGINVHSETQMQKFAESFGGFLYYQPLIVSYTNTNGEETETIVQSPFIMITQDMINNAARQSFASVTGQSLDIDVDQLIMSDSVIASQTKYQAPSIVRPTSRSHTHITIQRDFTAESAKIHSAGTTHLHVGGNAKMTTKTSGAKVSSTSSDRLQHASQISGDERLNMRVEGQEQLGHVVFQSQNEIQRTVLGDSINIPDVVERHETHHHGDTTISHRYKNHYSKIVEAPRVQELFGSDVVMTNIKYDVQELDITIAGNLALTTANDIHETTVRTEDEGWLSTSISQTTRGSSSSMGNRMNATQRLNLKVLGQDVYLQQLDIQSKMAEIYAPFARILFAQGVHQTWHSCFESDSSWIWNSGSMTQSQRQTFTSNRSNTRIKVTADKVTFERILDTGTQKQTFSFQEIQQKLLENVDGPLEKFLSKLDIESGNPIDFMALKELYESTSDSYSRPGSGLIIAVGIAATYLTAGAASYAGGYFAGSTGMTQTVAATAATTGLGSAGMTAATAGSTATLAAGTTLTLSTAGSMTAAMVSAGITAFSATAATSLLTSKGNLLEASKSLFSKQTLKSMTRSIFAAGTLYGLAAASDVGVNHAQASSRATATVQASQNTTQQALRSASMIEHSRTVALNFGANVATGLTFGESLNTSLGQSAVHSVASGVSGVAGDQLYESRLNDVEQMIAQSSMAAVIAGGLSGSNPGKTALIAYVSSLFTHLYMTQVCPNTVRVSEISRNAALVEVPDANLMEKSRVFAEIATALFSGLAGLDASQIQAVGSGVNIVHDQHQRRTERNIQQAQAVASSILEANLKAELAEKIENIRKARQQEAKEKEKQREKKKSSQTSQISKSSSEDIQNQYLSLEGINTLEEDINLTLAAGIMHEDIERQRQEDQKIEELRHTLQGHVVEGVKLSFDGTLTPRRMDGLKSYLKAMHEVDQRTLCGITISEKPKNPLEAFNEAYLKTQHELANDFKTKQESGRSLTEYEQTVLQHDQDFDARFFDRAAGHVGSVALGLASMHPALNVPARILMGAVGGGLGGLASVDYEVNTTTDAAIVAGSTLVGGAVPGSFASIKQAFMKKANRQITEKATSNLSRSQGLTLTRGPTSVTLPSSQRGVTFNTSTITRTPANITASLTEPSSQALRMTGTGGVSVVGGGNSTTSSIVKDRIKVFEGQSMGSKGPQTPGTTSTIQGGSNFVGKSSTSSSSASALGGGRLNREQIAPQLAENQVPYNPRRMEGLLNDTYGVENVSSSTLPRMNMPNVKMAGKEICLSFPNGEIKVPFDSRGYVILDQFSIFETRLSDATWALKDRAKHFKEATSILKQSLLDGQVQRSHFNEFQIKAIMKLEEKIPGYTWHHDLRKLQLVPEEIHNHPALRHVGGFGMFHQIVRK